MYYVLWPVPESLAERRHPTPTPLFYVASERNGAISSRGRQSAFSEVRRTLKTRAHNTKSTSKRYENIPKERKMARHVYAVVKTETKLVNEVLKANSQRGRSRENGGRQIRFPGEGEGKLRRLAPGRREPQKRCTSNINEYLGPRTSRTDTDGPLPRSFSGQPCRGGHVPSPTTAKGNGARRLRAGKAFGQSGLPTRTPQKLAKANRHPSGRIPSAGPRRRVARLHCGAYGLAMPSLITH